MTGHANTHTHTHIYIYIYIFFSLDGTSQMMNFHSLVDFSWSALFFDLFPITYIHTHTHTLTFHG